MSSDSAKSNGANFGAIVQARLGSTRLPGKVLVPVGGKPILQYVLERLRQVSQLSEIVVATSDSAEDDPIAIWCEYNNAAYFRGPLDDVADRFRGVLDTFCFDAFVRISADSPLLDHRLVERAIDLYDSQTADLVTNVALRTYPTGQSVEIVCTKTFLDTLPRMTEPDDREHVTTFFYKHANEFRIENFAKEAPCRDVEFAIDTPRHLEQFERIVAAMDRPHWEYGVDDLIRLHREVCGGTSTTIPGAR